MMEIKWLAKYRELQEFYKKHGHCVPTKEYGYLTRWARQQRRNYKNGTLSEEQIEALENIDFAWDSSTLIWLGKYSQLQEFYKKHGHCDVPLSNKHLARWLNTRKTEYKQGELNDKKITMLNALKISWDDIKDKELFKRQKLTVTLVKEYGICPFWANTYVSLSRNYKRNKSYDSVLKDRLLVRWITEQREAYKKQILSDKQVALLEDINFPWSDDEASLGDGYQQLKRFYKTNGHSNIPRQYAQYGKLRSWAEKQRRNYKNGKLSKEQIALLESLDFILDLSRAKWMVKYKELEEFYRTHGHHNVPKKNKSLRRWLFTQRRIPLDDEKINLLEEIYFFNGKVPNRIIETNYKIDGFSTSIRKLWNRTKSAIFKH